MPCPECKQLEKEVAKAELFFSIAYQSFEANEAASSTEEYLRLHQALFSAQKRLIAARDIHDRHLHTHVGDKTDQASNEGY
jgi:hypothetical protein